MPENDNELNKRAPKVTAAPKTPRRRAGFGLSAVTELLTPRGTGRT